ncbi:MAG: class I SAM-dependent methyltransferase [Pseudomonadales bacterium]
MSATSLTREQQVTSATEIMKASEAMQNKQYSEVISTLTPMLQAMDVDAPRTNEIFGLLMVADAQRFSGLIDDAYKNYVVASEISPEHKAQIEPHILKCLPGMKTTPDAPVFAEHLSLYLSKADLHSRAIDPHITNTLIRRYDLKNDDAAVDLATVITDGFFLTALRHAMLGDPFVEKFVSDIRREILYLTVENGLSSNLSPIVLALAEHAELVEYVYDISEDERVLLLGLKTLMETHSSVSDDASELLEPLLMYLMYEPITQLRLQAKLNADKIRRWPDPVKQLFKLTLLNPQEERKLANDLPCLKPISAEISQLVMGQYQENPYPRWRDLFTTDKPLPYIRIYPDLAQRITKPKKFERSLKCLVAGCGTGKHPIWLAASTKNMAVTAMDLSKPSLAYAKRQAIELGVADKIQFMQGDILDLEQLDTNFDVIECSGVLHHMEDPELGLSKLVTRLKTHGLLRIGLYSRIARDAIGVNDIRASEQAATLEEIRAQRSRILAAGTSPILRSRDFFTMSECRDLINHVQEHQFELPQIKALLERYNLEFLGFTGINEEIIREYRKQFAYDPEGLSLDNWHQFEQENPFIFKAMYQFHCQKRPTH